MTHFIPLNRQKPEERPSFSTVVDELLAIADELPAQNATKVSTEGMLCMI